MNQKRETDHVITETVCYLRNSVKVVLSLLVLPESVAKVKNEKFRNDVKVGHPDERDVNPEAGKLAINMDV